MDGTKRGNNGVRGGGGGGAFGRSGKDMGVHVMERNPQSFISVLVL